MLVKGGPVRERGSWNPSLTEISQNLFRLYHPFQATNPTPIVHGERQRDILEGFHHLKTMARADFGKCQLTLHLVRNFSISTDSGDSLNIKMLSYQYKDTHVKDKTVSRPSYLQHGNPHTPV